MIERFDVTTRTGRRFRVIYLGEGESSPHYPAVVASTNHAAFRGDMVEVYDLTYADDPRFTPDGQFVGRYYVDTLLNNHDPRIGINLGPEWNVDASTWDDVIVWLSLLRSRCTMTSP
jgi:hypothetical protein